MPLLFIVTIGWLYVALLMALAEAAPSNGSVVGAIVTFVLYGVMPVCIVGYILATPARKRARRARELAGQLAPQRDSGAPDASGETPADPVAPVGKEP